MMAVEEICKLPADKDVADLSGNLVLLVDGGRIFACKKTLASKSPYFEAMVRFKDSAAGSKTCTADLSDFDPVSYTHLTLPTILLV